MRKKFINKKLTDKDYIIIGKMWEIKSDLSEHRVIAALKLGRPLKKEEIVHHLDFDHSNNDPENLVICKNVAEHRAYHSGDIGKIRNSLGIKQKDLAKKIGITVTDLSFIENKIFYPTAKLAKKIAEILKAPLGTLWQDYELELILRKGQ